MTTMGTDEESTRPKGLEGWFRRRRRAAPEAHDEPAAEDASSDDRDDDAGTVVELDDDTFEDGTIGTWTVVAFWAPWCGPCRAFRPVFDEVARVQASPGRRFARCNVDASRRTARAWGIATVPTVSRFDPDGNEVERIVGVPTYQAFQALVGLAGDGLTTDDRVDGG